MSDLSKPFLSYEQQIEKLLAKGLVIGDQNFALEKLKQISYFALINAYKHPFRDDGGNKYKVGVTFEEIVALYEFDVALRELFLKYLFQIEITLKSLFAHYFTEPYGAYQSFYLDFKNYNYIQHSDEVKRLIEIIKKEFFEKSTELKYPYIFHQRSKHKNLPLWVLVSGLTFSNFAHMFKVSNNALKAKVAKNFSGIVDYDHLSTYLKVLCKFRNICSHNHRLFSYKSRDTIPNTKLHELLQIQKKGEQYKNGKSDLFAVAIAMRYLLSKSQFYEFCRNLQLILYSYGSRMGSMTHNQFLSLMGFVPNWAEISKIGS